MDWLAPAAQHAERIFRAARGVAPDDDAAWDCVQEAFATALERDPAPDDPVAWLCGVARNHARHYVRAHSRWIAALERLAHRPARRPPDPLPDLHEALKRLPMKLRDAVILRYLAGMSHTEVAQAQGITETAAKARVQRGLARLRHVLGAAALASLLAREAAAAHGKVAALKKAALLLPAGGLVVKKWAIAVVALLCVLGTGLVWRATRDREPVRGADTRGGPGAATRVAAADAPGETESAAPGPPRFAPPAAYPADRPVVPLRGYVVDAAHRPVEGAEVRIALDRGGMLPELAVADDRAMKTQTVETDARGAFSLDVPSGPYRLAASGPGGYAVARVAAGPARGPVMLVLSEPPGPFVVAVRDEAGAPVPDARIEVVAGLSGEGIRTFEAVTDEEGLLRFFGPPFGSVVARAWAGDGRAGWVAQTAPWPPRPQAEPLVVTVSATCVLAGRILGVDAALVEGARVTAWALTAPKNPYWSVLAASWTTEVAAGRYAFGALAPGTYALTLDAPRGVRLVTEPHVWGRTPLPNSAEPVLVEVAPGGAVRDLAAAPGAVLEGVVTRDGAPVERALVRVTYAPSNSNFPDGFVLQGVNVWRLDSDLETSHDHPATHWQAFTDAEGRYRLASLPPGRMRVEVFAPGLSFDRREGVEVSEGSVTRLEHRLVPAGVLQVAVHGVSYFGLVPEGADAPVLLAIIAGREAVTLPGLPAGRYRAGAFHSDPAQGVIADLGTTEIVAGRTTWWDLRGTGAYVVRGHVTDPAGPVAGVRVRTQGAPPAETDAQGAFELRSPVRFGNAVAVLVEEGPLKRSFTFQTGNNEEVTVGIALAGNVLVVRTEGAAGEPAPALVQIREAAHPPELAPAQVRSAGDFRLRHLRAGRYSLHARFAGGAEVATEVGVPETREVVLREPPTGRLEVEVAGAPAGTVVSVTARREGAAPEDEAAYLGWFAEPLGDGGAALFPAIPAGDLQIHLEMSNWGPSIPSRMGDGEPRETHAVTLEAGGTLRVRLSAAAR